MISEKAKPWLAFALLGFIVLGISAYARPNFSFSWDSHNKLVQSFSLWEQGFSSDELFYHFSTEDPNYRFFPHGANAFGKIDGRYVSAFPVALAALFAPVWSFLGPAGVVLLSASFLIGCCWLLYRFWNFRGFWLFVPVLLTFLMSFTLEFSEHLIVAFLSFAGLSLWLKAKRPMLGGTVIALALFFRHETLPLLLAVGMASIASSLFETYAQKTIDSEKVVPEQSEAATSNNFFQRIKESGLLQFTLAASILVFSFSGFNLFLYGHPLGPRFLINASGLSVSPALRAEWAFDLLFWHNVKPGLFGYMPGLAFVLLIAIFFHRRLETVGRILLGTVLIYIPVVLLIVPNNGIMDWGPRYFGPILLPSVVLAREIWHLKQVPARRILQAFLIALSLVTITLNYAGLKFLRNARKTTATAIQQMKDRNADVWVFAGIDIFYYSGVEYTRRPILSINDHKELPELLGLLQSSAPGKKILFIALPAPMQESHSNRPDGAGTEASTENEVLEMQVRNSLSPEEKSSIREFLMNPENGIINPGLIYIEGIVKGPSDRN
ncbi:MAG: hypothetical protein RH862_02180 [Leptospiraceae bacterium]